MTTLGLFVIAGCLIWILREVIQDIRRGLQAAVTVFVIMPQQLKISVAGLPDLSINRLVLLLFLPFLPRLLRESAGFRRVPYVLGLLSLGGVQLLSTIFSVDLDESIKQFLSFFFEVLLFYVLVTTSIRDWSDVVNLVLAVCRGLLVVAVLGTIEKYWGFNAFESLTSRPVENEWGVVATYPHRILFGYAMAMALPLMLLWTAWATKVSSKVLAWLAVLLVIAACYFSTSRGPWMAAALAGVVLMVLDGRESIRKLIFLAGLAMLVCVVRPGVWQSITGLSEQTFETGTVKASSYDYRWKLWGVAMDEIEKSPTRLLFGYGGQSEETMDLSRYFGHEEGGLAVTIGFTSWDNNMACYLIEFGVVGFTLEMLIYLFVIFRLISSLRSADHELKRFINAITVSCLVYIFALSNVYIFAPQLNYLFWTLVALGATAVRVWPTREAKLGESLENLEKNQTLALGETVQYAAIGA